MDNINNVFMNFLKILDLQWRDRNLPNFIKNIFICVLNTNEGLISLEWLKGRNLQQYFE